MKQKILIVDDELEMRKLISLCLKSNYEIEEASSGYEALQKLLCESYDLVILDVMMPSVDGYEVLKQIRESIDPNLPIVMLTALGDTDQVVLGLNSGADDYIVKPFEPRELTARINSVLRRFELHSNYKTKLVKIHELTIDADKITVTYQGIRLPLTKKEFNILYRLASNPGRVYSREQLLELEWGHDYEGDTRTVDTHIKNIRDKLKKIGFTKDIIQTNWGIGYQMIEENE